MVARVLLAVVVAACGSGISSGGSDGGGGSNAQNGVERFVGRIATSPTVEFGGTPYCMYSVTMTNVTLDVTLHPVSGVVNMVITNTRIEDIVGTCPYLPAPDNAQAYEHLGAPTPPTSVDMFEPPLMGIDSNHPRTDATTVVIREKDTRLTATVHWDRTDQDPPLDFTVTTPVPIILDRVTCEIGDIYCLGGSTQGAEYGCVDGVKLVQSKPCVSGCGPITLPPLPHTDEACK